MQGDGKLPVYTLYQYIWNIADLLYPPQCAGCGAKGYRWCTECQERTNKISHNLCRICGVPSTSGDVCKRCKESPPKYDQARSWSKLDGPIHKAVLKLKYRQDYGLGDVFTQELTTIVIKQEWDIEIIVPVPLGKKRQMQRGYNQSAAIARPLAWSLDIPYKPKALKRLRETTSQVRLSMIERERNVMEAFQASKKVVEGMNVLLVDDVMTTGATLNACTIALKNANADKVYGITLSRAIEGGNPWW